MRRFFPYLAIIFILTILYPAKTNAGAYTVISPSSGSASYTCTDRNNCTFYGVVGFKNNTDKTFYKTTIWTDDFYNKLEFVGFDGNWTTKSVSDRIREPGDTFSIEYKVTFPKEYPSDVYYTSLYADGHVCNTKTNPPDCYAYGGTRFQIKITIISPTPTPTPTSTPTPTPTLTPTPIPNTISTTNSNSNSNLTPKVNQSSPQTNTQSSNSTENSNYAVIENKSNNPNLSSNSTQNSSQNLANNKDTITNTNSTQKQDYSSLNSETKTDSNNLAINKNKDIKNKSYSNLENTTNKSSSEESKNQAKKAQDEQKNNLSQNHKKNQQSTFISKTLLKLRNTVTTISNFLKRIIFPFN